jgi:hypothetical protein
MQDDRRQKNIHFLYHNPERGFLSFGNKLDMMLRRNCSSSLRWSNEEVDFAATYLAHGVVGEETLVALMKSIIEHRKNGDFDKGSKF